MLNLIGLFIIIMVFFIGLTIKKRKILFNELKLYLKSIYPVAMTEKIDDGIDKPIKADYKVNAINVRIDKILKENKFIYLFVTQSNMPIILSNVALILKKYSQENNLSKEREDLYFKKVYETLRYPNKGRCKLIKDLQSI